MATSERPDCAEVVLELPWLASGALDEEVRRRVEAHLADCAACRAEAARCRAERELVRAAAAPAAAPHPAQLARLLARLDAAPADPDDGDDAGAAPPPAATSRRRRGAFAGTPRAARWLIAAQLVALAGLGLYAARPAATPAPRTGYRTLSAAPAAAPRGVLRVVFAPGTSEADLRALLLSVRAEIVGGPSAAGAYTLALDGAGAAEPVDEVLGLLRADPRIRFAEPVAGNDAPPR